MTVFAASSLVNVLEDMSRKFRNEKGGRVAMSYQSSGILARQIENGAPADMFVSADRAWIDRLNAGGHLDPGTVRAFAANRLVLVAPRASPLPRRVPLARTLLADLASGPLALGNPDHVPAGRYARAALAALGLWAELEGRSARTPDVRTALTLVERGAAPLGIVYATDARSSGQVRIVARFPQELHGPIVYWAALVRGRSETAAQQYYARLFAPDMAPVLLRHGFSLPAG